MTLTCPACSHEFQEPPHLEGESHLPPVSCPLLVEYEGNLVLVERTGIIEDKGKEMEYALLDNNQDRQPTGEKIYGRLRWTYP